MSAQRLRPNVCFVCAHCGSRKEFHKRRNAAVPATCSRQCSARHFKTGERRAKGAQARAAVWAPVSIPKARWLELAREQQARFWSFVHKTDGCWVWVGGKCKDGYGKFAITSPRGCLPKQKHVRAHRLAWELANGEMSSDLVTIHKCDNPACVNPGHVRPGSQRENIDDAISKGRHTTQVYCGRASTVDFGEVARLRALGMTHSAIATSCGISRPYVSTILNRRASQAGQLPLFAAGVK